MRQRDASTPRRRLSGVVLATLLLAALPARAEGPWEGFWELYSVGEGAYLSLRQEGDRVVGTYFPYEGQIEGVAEDGVLRGTWRSPNGEGTVLFALTPDRQHFSGSIGAGEWWNGSRITEDDIGVLSIDLRDPGRTVRSFVTAGRAYRNGEISGLQAMFSALHFDEDPAFAEKSRRSQLLYDVLGQTTFRIFEIRGASGSDTGDDTRFVHRFEQAGTDESIELAFQRDNFELWRIRVPSEEVLLGARQRLLAARGLEEIDPTRYRALAHPRHTVEAFLHGMETWESGGAALVQRTLDFSEVSEKLRSWRLPVVATFVASNLNRMGRLTPEEIPDDPDRTRPFVLYEHPVGDIVMAPTVDAGGTTRWRFDVATVEHAKRLHDALRTVPVTFDNVKNPRIDNPYFRARSMAYALTPRLTGVLGPIEIWQWLGLLLFAVGLPLVLHGVMSWTESALARATTGGANLQRLRGYGLLLRLLAVGVLWILASTRLGLPNAISGALYAAGWVVVILAITWQIYRFLDVATRALHKLAKQTEGTADDVAVTLVSGTAKVLLIVGAGVAIADVLGLPYQTVLAGIGVSGLAFAIASRDLLANLFGSLIIASDRPFKRGDFISVGEVTGTVERVGLRSTRLRTVDDTTVAIPNSRITTDRVVNISKRRKIRVLETIHISHDASIEDVRGLRERIREELLADPMVAEENVRVGLATVGLHSLDLELSFFLKTTNFDEYLQEKHRIMAHVLATLEAAGVERAILRRD